MDDPNLTTTEDVMTALGGVPAVMALTGGGYKAVSNWKSFPTFPARHFVVMNDALAKIGKTAPASLWAQTEIPADADEVAS